MIQKTRGIVLHHIKYSDSSIIVSVYTEKFGRLSFLVNQVHGKKSKNKVSLFQPLSILEMEVYFKAKRELQRISEVRIHIPYHSIYNNIVKNTICLFLAEILFKTLQEEEHNENLFNYLIHALKFLDLDSKFTANFHLVFLMNFSKHLGIYPNFESYSENSFFDLKEGDFKKTIPYHQSNSNVDLSKQFYNLSRYTLNTIDQLKLTGRDRKELLELLINYYILHHDNIAKLNSYDILKEVFS